MNYVDLVAVLAVMQLIFFSVLVARSRGTYGVKAPAVSGHEVFERAYRVQMNTLELMVAFLPALFIASKYWPQTYVASAGAVYLLGASSIGAVTLLLRPVVGLASDCP